MSNDFFLSIAQKYMLFITQFVKVVVAGDNYKKAMIFVSDTDSATYLSSAQTAGYTVEVSYFDYQTYAKGKLKTWLDDYFAENKIATCFIVVWDDGATFSSAGLATEYALVSTNAYFKLGIHATHQKDVDLAGATLCTADPLLSQWWMGTADSTILTATEDNEADLIIDATKDARIIYHPDATRNGALFQLGLSLGQNNSTQTPVGNSLDFIQTDLITASGTAGINLTSVEAGNCKDQYVGYFTTLGDSSGRVALDGVGGAGLTTLGHEPCAYWIASYVDFVSSVYSAQFMTQINRFRNDATYQGVLAILVNQLQKFSTLGRLSNLKITAPKFSDLTLTADSFVVPNAWSATFVGNARQCTVSGTLFIPA